MDSKGSGKKLLFALGAPENKFLFSGDALANSFLFFGGALYLKFYQLSKILTMFPVPDLLGGSSYQNKFDLIGQGLPDVRYFYPVQKIKLVNILCHTSKTKSR